MNVLRFGMKGLVPINTTTDPKPSNLPSASPPLNRLPFPELDTFAPDTRKVSQLPILFRHTDSNHASDPYPSLLSGWYTPQEQSLAPSDEALEIPFLDNLQDPFGDLFRLHDEPTLFRPPSPDMAAMMQEPLPTALNEWLNPISEPKNSPKSGNPFAILATEHLAPESPQVQRQVTDKEPGARKRLRKCSSETPSDNPPKLLTSAKTATNQARSSDEKTPNATKQKRPYDPQARAAWTTKRATELGYSNYNEYLKDRATLRKLGFEVHKYTPTTKSHASTHISGANTPTEPQPTKSNLPKASKVRDAFRQRQLQNKLKISRSLKKTSAR